MFKRCSNSIVKELNIPIDQNLLNDGSIFDYSIIAAVHKYERHPSILEIKEKVKKYDQIRLLRLLGLPNKTTQQSDIPVRIIKKTNSHFQKFCLKYLTFTFNILPNGLKKADIKPIYEKDEPLDKTNCRPISILIFLSKAFLTLLI